MNFKLPRWRELPDMDLYLEQVLSLLDQWLGGKVAGKGKSVMTKTMINNYVRQKIIPAPINKKYEKRAVAALFLIAYLKSVYAIPDIARLIGLAMGREDMAEAYDRFCDFTEQAVEGIFAKAPGEASENPQQMDYLMKAVAGSFAGQLYVMREHLHRNK